MESVVNKIVIFDMDNTILKGRFIDACAEKMNFRHALSLLRQIDKVPVSLTRRIAQFLAGKKKSYLIEIAAGIPLIEDVAEVSKKLRERGYRVGIVSDSYQFVTDYIGEIIHADFTIANDLLFRDDITTGEVNIHPSFFPTNESLCAHQVCKLNVMQYLCKQYGSELKSCIAIGDSENDHCMVQYAGFGMSFCTSNIALKQAANAHIESHSFADILRHAV